MPSHLVPFWLFGPSPSEESPGALSPGRHPRPLPQGMAAMSTPAPSSGPGRHVNPRARPPCQPQPLRASRAVTSPSTAPSPEAAHALPASPSAPGRCRAPGGCSVTAVAPLQAVGRGAPGRALRGPERWRRRGSFPAGAGGGAAPGPERREPWKRAETVRERRREDAEPRAALAAGARVPG